MRLRQLCLVPLLCAATLACVPKPPTSSSVKIVNGSDVDPSHDVNPAVVHLILGDGSTCSGTFISPSVVLTAAHCIEASRLPVVDIDSARGKTASYFRHPRFYPKYYLDADGRKIVSRRFDMGVIVFSEDVASDWVELAASSVEAGSAVVMVGYGASDRNGEGTGTKRIGTNSVAAVLDSSTPVEIVDYDEVFSEDRARRTTVNQSVIQVTGPWEASVELGGADGGQSTTDHGDSGGSLFVGADCYRRGGSSCQLVGTVSGGPIFTHTTDKHSFFVNLFHPENLAFLRCLQARGARIAGLPTAEWVDVSKNDEDGEAFVAESDPKASLKTYPDGDVETCE